MVAFGQDTWITDVLELLERRVADRTGLPRDKVFTYFGAPEDLLQFTLGDKFCSVAFEDMAADKGIVVGGGAAQSAFDSVLVANLFVRTGLDRETFDVKLLRDKQAGFGLLFKKVCEALQTAVLNTGNASPLREPTMLLRARLNPRRPATGWAWVEVRAQARFRADLLQRDADGAATGANV